MDDVHLLTACHFHFELQGGKILNFSSKFGPHAEVCIALQLSSWSSAKLSRNLMVPNKSSLLLTIKGKWAKNLNEQ